VTKNLVLVGGQPARESVELHPRGRDLVLRRRFRASVPWTVAGAGAGAGVVGAGLILLGHANYSAYESELAARFPDGAHEGELPSSLASLHTRAVVENGAGIAMAALGGSALIAGLVMVGLNQPRAVEVAPVVVVGAGAHDVSVTWLGRF
jgi:hypothetical protein